MNLALVEDLKKCKRCHIEKTIDNFYINSNKGRHENACKTCFITRNLSRQRKYLLKKWYNLSINDYNQMFMEQNGKCKICKTHQNNQTKALNVDHCHKTGKVRGLLCGHCNKAIGLMRDDISILKEAISYLEES